MLRLTIIITSLLLIQNNAVAQVPYSGGTNNGFSAQTEAGISLFVTDSLYNGDNRNGFSSGTTNADLSVADSIYTGDSTNGFTKFTQTSISLFLSDSLYNGDNRNGFSFGTTNADLSVVDSIYNGDSTNGFTKITQAGISLFVMDSVYNGNNRNGFYQTHLTGISLLLIDSLYNGETGRGETVVTVPLVDLSMPCSGTVFYWNGSVNIVWGNANNWDCGVLPGISSIVIIPAGKPRYPTLFTNAEIKSLHLKPGSTITINSNAALILNGQ